MRFSPRNLRLRPARLVTALGAGLLTAILATFTTSPAQAQIWNNYGLGGFGTYGYGPGYGLNGLGYGYNTWGGPGFGIYNGLGYGGYNGLGYGGYGGYGAYNGLGYGAYGSGLNINLGGRNLLHVGPGVNPLWRNNRGLGVGRGYYSRNWYGRNFDNWYDRID